MRNPLAQDLNDVLAHTRELWEDLRGQRLFMTGGTGFFGCWLLESFVWANAAFDLKASATILTRHVDSFRRRAPHLAANPAVQIHRGDVRECDFPEGEFSYVIHAATDARAARDRPDRLAVFDTIVDGTRRTLEFASGHGTKRFLLTSSGAVYGRQPSVVTRVSEEHTGGPDLSRPALAGAEAKRAAEMLCAVYAGEHFQPLIARCFTFVGPYLPLDAHFAIGNFIRDGMRGGPISILGKGTARRSYMYATDLMIWLWWILFRGRPMRPYNVGSEEEISIAEVAHAVARHFQPEPAVNVLALFDDDKEHYVPNTSRARSELGVTLTVDLDEGLRRTISWCAG
jgi:dTDP-glucose 4,6-dehydratase